jgi:hypothetical protein
MAIPVLDSFLADVAASTGLPADLLKIASCLVLSYPFSAILKRLPDHHRELKDVFCIA